MPTAAPVRFLANEMTVHVPDSASGGRFSLVEATGPAGDQPPLHVHQAEDETFYVLEGELRLWIGPESLTVAAGECALAPRGVPHTYRVESDGARWLVVCAPGGFDRFVTQVAAGPQDPATLTAVAAGFGIEILGPPGSLPA